MDMSKVSVTIFRGYMRMTAVTDRLTFQPTVGDTMSGGWEITDNEFGKVALSMNQFLLRLVCTNGAVVSEKEQNRYVHRGWQREDLIKHLSSVGEATLSRMKGLNDKLRMLAETRLGESQFSRLEQASAKSLGRTGLETYRSSLTTDSSIYDAYNHLTYVSQQKKLGPNRDLEMIAGQLLMKHSED